MFIFSAVFLAVTATATPAPLPAPSANVPPAPASAPAAPVETTQEQRAADDLRKIVADAPRVAALAARNRAFAIASARQEVDAARSGGAASPRLAAAWRALGFAYESDHAWHEASAAYDRASRTDDLARREASTSVDAEFDARTEYALHAYRDAGLLDAACLDHLRHPGDFESPLANECRRGLARVWGLEGRWKAAERLVDQALRFDEADRPWDDASRAADLTASGYVLVGEERYTEALADFGRADKLARSTTAASGPYVALSDATAPGVTRATIGASPGAAAIGDVALADFYLLANDRVREMKSGELHSADVYAVELAAADAGTAMGGAHVGDPDDKTGVADALAYDRESDRTAGHASVDTADAYRVLGDMRFALHDDEGARIAILDAKNAYREALGPRYPELGALDGRLGRIAIDEHRNADAIRLLKLALHERDGYGLAAGPAAQWLTALLAQAYDGLSAPSPAIGDGQAGRQK